MSTPPLTRAAFDAKVNNEWEAWGKVIRDRKLGGIGGTVR